MEETGGRKRRADVLLTDAVTGTVTALNVEICVRPLGIMFTVKYYDLDVFYSLCAADLLLILLLLILDFFNIFLNVIIVGKVLKMSIKEV